MEKYIISFLERIRVEIYIGFIEFQLNGFVKAHLTGVPVAIIKQLIFTCSGSDYRKSHENNDLHRV